MVTKPEGNHKDVEANNISTYGRPVCDKPKQQVTLVLQPGPGTRTNDRGCPNTELVQANSLYAFPPTLILSFYITKEHKERELCDYSYSAPLVKAIMVHNDS